MLCGLMVMVSKEVIVSCMMCFIEILLCVAISTPLLGVFPSSEILSFLVVWYQKCVVHLLVLTRFPLLCLLGTFENLGFCF